MVDFNLGLWNRWHVYSRTSCNNNPKTCETKRLYMSVTTAILHDNKEHNSGPRSFDSEKFHLSFFAFMELVAMDPCWSFWSGPTSYGRQIHIKVLLKLHPQSSWRRKSAPLLTPLFIATNSLRLPNWLAGAVRSAKCNWSQAAVLDLQFNRANNSPSIETLAGRRRQPQP